MMYDWLKHYDSPVCIVATKADKIPRSRWQKHIKIIKEALVMRGGDKLIMFSSETGIGKDELWAHIAGFTHPNEPETEKIEE